MRCQRMWIGSAIGLLTVIVSGCSQGSEEQAASPSPAASPAPVAAKPPAQPQAFPSPVVPPNPPAAEGLIQSTNPEERVRQVQQGRSDPFSVLPVPPVVIRPPAKPPTPKPVTVNPNTVNPGIGNPANRNNGGKPALPSLPTAPGTPGIPTIPKPALGSLPPLPEPTLAKAVQVTGVVQIGPTTQVIVKAPDEEMSRYVQVGQRLSNGQVLVKRVDMAQGSEPVVVFEQFGIEVPRPVGPEPETVPPTPGVGSPATPS